MSKAKELATTVLEIHSLASSDVSFNLCELAIKVLSEPEPELKGWIEVDEQGLVMSININQIEWFGDQRIRLANGDSSVRLLIVKESYDELKQKIKEAS